MDSKDLDSLILASRVILAIEITLGTVGNVISLTVWSKGRKCSKAACSTYLKLLSIADMFVLLVPAFKFLLDLCRIPLSHVHVIFCKVFGFSELFGSQISAWLIVCLSFERMLSLCFPLRFRINGARKRAYICAVIIVVIAAGLNSMDLINRTMFHYSYNFTNATGQTEMRSKIVCVTTLTEEYEMMNMVSFIWFLGILPFVFVTTCNSISVVKIFNMRKMQRITVQRHSNAASFTKLCFAVGILYCVSTLPLTIHSLNLYKIIKVIEINTIPYVVFRMFAYICFYLNNSLNFFLYCFAGADFRKDLNSMLPCLQCKPKRQSQSIILTERSTRLTSFYCSAYTLQLKMNGEGTNVTSVREPVRH